ncbi:MAG: invasin domain 3-containing protein [Myxococcales bacterium]
MRAHLMFRLAALGVGLLALTGCPQDTNIAPGDLDPSVSVVSVSKAKGVLADGVDRSFIEVKLLDKNQNAIKGKDVVLVATGSGNTLTQPSSATNDYGVAIGSIASTDPEVKTISAKVGSITLTTKPTVEFVTSIKPAVKLAITVPATGTVGTALTPAVTVSLLDDTDTVTPVTGAVELKLGDNPGAATLGGTVSAAAVDGVATFADLTLNKVGKGYTLVASLAGVPDATSQRFDVGPGAATALVISELPASATAGATLGFTVTAQDALGNVATGYTGTVAITSGDTEAILPSAHTFTTDDAGVFAFTGLVLKTAGAQSVTAADGTLTTAGTVSIAAGAATRLLVSGLSSPSAAGTEGTLHVVASDDFGNTDPTYTGTVKVTVENNADPMAVLPADYAFQGSDSGAHDFKLTLKTAGLHDVVATDVANSAISGKQGGVQVVPGATATRLVVAGLPASVSSGEEQSFTVTGVDGFDNTVIAYQGPVTFSTGVAGDVLPAQSMLVNGTGSFKATFKNAGARTLTVTDGTINGTATTNVTPSGTTHLVFTTQPANTAAGAALSFAVTVKDAQGNTDTAFTGEVTIAKASGTGALAGTTAKNAVAGVATFGAAENLRFDVAGAYTLSATATGPAAATSASFNVVPGSVHHLVFTAQPADTAAGAAISLEVTAQDSLNNVATGFTGNVTLAKGSGPGTLAGTLTKAAVAGVATFGAAENLHFDSAGSYTLTAAATGATSATSNAFDVTTGSVDHLVFTVQPANVAAGAALALTVTAQDSLNNPVTGFTGNVTLAKASGPGTLAGTAVKAAVAGVATFGATENVHFDTAGAYTLTASATGATAATSNSFTVSAGAAHHLVFSVQPADTTAGSTINLEVTAKDSLNNTATAFTGPITLAKASGTGALLGTLTKSAVAGVAAFGATENVHLDVASAYTLTASATGLTAATSASFTVAPAATTHLTFTTQPANTAAGAAISVVVTVQDTLGNPDTAFTGNVTLSKASGTGTLAGTLTRAAVAGVATFGATENVHIDTAGTYTLTASAAGPASATSTAFDITPGSAHHLVFSAQPATTAAGAAIALTVTAQDSLNNTATSFTGNVALAKTSGPASGTLAGTQSKAAVAGVATFGATESLHIDYAGAYTLTASASGLTSATSNSFDVTPGAAHHLAFTLQPAASTAAGAAISVEVTAQDALNNKVAAFTGNVTLAKASGPGAGVLAGTATKAAVAGVATFGATENLHIDLVGNYTLSATATSGPSAATSNSFDVTAGTAHHLVFTVQPGNVAAGAPIAVTVTAQDSLNNVATGFTGSIALAKGAGPASGTLLGTTSKAATAGVAVFGAADNAHFDVAGTYALTASATGPTTATSASFDVAAGSAHHLVFSAQPANTAAGATIALTVTAQDSLNNPATSFTGTVTLAKAIGSGSLAGTTSKAAVAGVASFGATEALHIDVTGSYTLTASATGLTSATSASFDVTPGSAHHLVFSAQPANTAAGSTIALTVTAQDSLNNTATAFTGNVTIAKATGPGSGTLSGTVTKAAAAGVAAFGATENLRLNLVGSYTLSATAASGPTAATSASFDIVAGAAHHLVFSVQPASTQAGSAISLEVTAQDSQNNVATGFAGSVTIAKASGTGALLGTTSKTAAAGVVAFGATENLHIDTVGAYTLTASATGPTPATSSSFNITPGASTQLVFTVQPGNTAAGAAIALQVTVKDGSNNTDTSFVGNVTLAKASGPAGGTLAGTVTKAAVAGVATFGATENLHFDLVGTYTLTATATGPSSGTSTSFDVTPGAAHHLVFTAQPANTTAHTTIGLQVTAQDSLNNVATGYSGTITLARATGPSGGVLGGTKAKAATAGVATFGAAEALWLDVAGDYTLSATGSAVGTGATSNSFHVSPGATVFLEVLAATGTITAGVAHNFTVNAYDQDLNLTTGYTGTVHFTSSDATAVLPSDATLTSGTGTFPVTFKSAGTGRTLTVTDTVTATLTDSATVTVGPGAATGFVVTGIPSPYTAGAQSSPTVKAVDGFGNTATGYTGTVHFTSSDTGASLPADTAFVAGDAGIRTFTNGVRLVKATSAAFVKVEQADNAAISGSVTAINVVAGTKAALAFKVQPSKAKKNTVIAPAVQVEIRDASGNPTTDTDNITVALVGSATLSGTKTVAAVAGVASFADLAVDTAGSYTLTAGSGSLTAATSAAFQVVTCSVDSECNDSSGCTTDTCNTTTGECVFAGGACTTPDVCFNNGCCTPSCAAKECGSDGCGGSCAPGCGSTETCNASQKCVYRHTLNLADGATNDFWTGEFFNTTSAGYVAYVSWDATNLYIGYSGADVTPSAADAGSKWLHVYLDTDLGGANGSATGYTYNTQTPAMPVGFKADYHYGAKMDFTYAQTSAYSGSAWGTAASVTPPAHAGTYTEFAIPLASLGNPSKVGIVSLMINEKAGSEWTYAGLYTDNFTDGYSTSMMLTRYLLADFGAKAAPNDAANKRLDETASSAQISAVRAATPGAISLPVERTLVSYLKPNLGSGNDGVGFYVQSKQTGPALLVALDPATYGLAVGDRVSFTATTLANVSGILQATAITNLVKQGTGDVDALVQNVNSVDLVTELANYDSELISGTFTVATAFASSGTGFMAANVTTTGVPTSTSSFRLRLPTTLQTQFDLGVGCQLALVRTPLFRFNTTSEPSAWVAGDFTVSCPAPMVVSASPTGSTSLTVAFSRQIDPATVTANGAQFTFDKGLTASAASVSGNNVTLTTSAQAAGTTYTLTVATTVKDTLGTNLNSTANTTTFTTASSSTCTVEGWKIVQANASVTYTIPAGTAPIPAGGYLIVGRGVDKATFQTFWGVTLGANVTYLNGGGTFPSINGAETYTLQDATSAVVDGPSIAMAGAATQNIQRKSPIGDASLAASWNVLTSATLTNATPGTSPLSADATKTLVISEFSDASTFNDEFVELFCAK